LVKEADALADAGYEVTILYANWNNWGIKFDQQLIPSKKWKAICVGGDPQKKKVIYVFSRLMHKLARVINEKSGGRYLSTLAITRAAFFLMRETKKHRADIYIAHNLGALPAVVQAASANKKPCGFDAEDFHRFEVSDDTSSSDAVLKSGLEDRYIPKLDYLTASSPLIADAYRKLYPSKNPVVILNVFKRDLNIKQPELNLNGPLKLLWFSQTVGANRGLEDVIKAMQLLKGQAIELHILGFLPPNIKTGFIDKLVGTEHLSIHFHDPVPPDSLTEFASKFNIGLALEPAFSVNNDLALSNKIFTYIQAGLAIVASNTSAQLKFMVGYPAIGKVYPKGDPNALADILLSYYQNPEQLFEAQQAALLLARQKLNWETEKEKFLSIVNEILTRN